MRKIEIRTKHNLNKEETKNKLLIEVPLLQEKYKNELKNLVIDWQDDTKFTTEFSVMGMKFKGNGEILEKELISILELRGAAELFYKRIQNAIEFKLNEILN